MKMKNWGGKYLRGSDTVTHIMNGQEKRQHPGNDPVLDHVHQSEREESLDHLALATSVQSCDSLILDDGLDYIRDPVEALRLVLLLLFYIAKVGRRVVILNLGLEFGLCEDEGVGEEGGDGL